MYVHWDTLLYLWFENHVQQLIPDYFCKSLTMFLFLLLQISSGAASSELRSSTDDDIYRSCVRHRTPKTVIFFFKKRERENKCAKDFCKNLLYVLMRCHSHARMLQMERVGCVLPCWGKYRLVI